TQGRVSLADFQLLLVPGGFSYADALGAGKLLALDLDTALAEQMRAFVAAGKPVLGICNGFQALLKAGLFEPPASGVPLTTTLTFNQAGHFECRWVRLAPRSQRCVWTRGLTEAIECPVAHGEGNFTPASPARLADLQAADQVALVYVRADG